MYGAGKLHQNKMNLNQIDSGDEKKIVVFSQHGKHCLSNGCIIYIMEPENESIAMILWAHSNSNCLHEKMCIPSDCYANLFIN